MSSEIGDPSSSQGNNNNKMHAWANLTKSMYFKDKIAIQKRAPVHDMLSKNISFLLENLLKRYENSHLPTHGQGIIFFCFFFCLHKTSA